MSEFHFKVDGLTEENLRRWKKPTEPSVLTAPLLAWTAAAAIAVYSVGTLNTIALMNIEAIRSKNLLVIRDVSGSMKGTEKKLQGQIARLKDSGVLVDELTADGFGVSTAGNSRNLLNRLKEGLRANLNVDAVYVFSDFTYIDEPIDGNNEAGYQQLRELLTGRKLRLYLGTVRDQPSDELIAIAWGSGGGMINSK